MRKYLSVFYISFQQEFVYKLNFIMWRVRNILQIFIVFYLWSSVFSQPNKVIFGYDKAKILTYIFGLIIIRAFVLSARAADVAGDIANGNFLNLLLKPVSYFKYWLTRDLSSKALNLIFAFFETILLFYLLKPPFFIQTNPLYLIAFIASVSVAMLTYFLILFVTDAIPFWAPEMGWGGQFLITTVIVEFLSGSLFPLDILPATFQKIISYTPFPYLIFFPLQVYLGKVGYVEMIYGIGISLIWLIVLWYFMRYVWGKGLKAYQAYGR